MSNSKISALTSTTTPLAGTETLPIVQSGATKKIATDDLTVKNVRSNATTGILQITGPAAAATRVATVPDANWTAARTDAAQSFTGDQTLSTGNLVIGTSGKGIDFSATAGTGTSELLADYEEGTWTPTQGASLTVVGAFSSAGSYTKVGRLVTVNGYVAGATSVAASSGGVFCGGLPFTAQQYNVGGCRNAAYSSFSGVATAFSNSNLYSVVAVSATTQIVFTITYWV